MPPGRRAHLFARAGQPPGAAVAGETRRTAQRIHLAADDPAAAHRALGAALA